MVARFHRLIFLLVAWEGLVGFDVEGFVGEEVEHEGAGLGLDALHALLSVFWGYHVSRELVKQCILCCITFPPSSCRFL